MTELDARVLKVVLTGGRLTDVSEDELSTRLQAKFKLTPEQSAELLKGRRVVKRGIDSASATKLANALRALGLEAVIEESRSSPGAPPAPSPKMAPVAAAGRVPASVDTERPPSTRAPAPVPAPAAIETEQTPAAPPSLALAPRRERAPDSAERISAAPAAGERTSPARAPVAAAAAVPPAPTHIAPAHAGAAAPAPEKSALEVLQALGNQRLPKPRTSFTYMLGLALVTLLCIALPATYIGLTGGIAYGWFWYLTHIHHHLPHMGKLVVLIYAVPGFSGALLVLFLLRPLFAPRRKPPAGLKLDPNREAAFISGVHALCKAIGVSPPAEIELSWDANASVHFRTRWLSFFTGHKVLTIGMSLVGGLTARQFVGVLAHEFGHFAQRFGMICSFTVNSVNAWLEHRAYGEDAWDRKLRAWSEEQMEQESWYSGIVNISIFVSWLAIGLTRKLMALLFHISLRLSRYMSRQMEFDADRYEALLAGSDMFRQTARSLRALNHAFVEVNRANIEAWQEQRLLRNLPEAVAVHAQGFDAARLAKIEEEMRGETTARYWDSHPPDAARIENAEKGGFPGLYHVEAPAASMFKDFTAWSKLTTERFYAEQEVRYRPEQLRSREEILGSAQDRSQKREQVNRFFNGQFQEWPLLRLDTANAVAAPGWQECIDQIRSRSPDIARNWSSALQMHEQRPILRAAIALGATSRQMGLPGVERSSDALGVELGNIAGQTLPCYKPLNDSFVLYAQRLQHAIDAMSGDEQIKAASLRDTLVGLGEVERDISQLDELIGAVGIYRSIAENHGGSVPPNFDQIEKSFGECATRVLTRVESIAQTVAEGGTVAAYLRKCCPHLPAPDKRLDPPDMARASGPMAAAIHRLYLLALGELVSLCEAAEKARGIRPIRLVA
jgi:Zn-dependent protease with chaperone function/signal recognition particle subunit SEC65